VQPYPHVYRTFTKGRWVGKELLATLVKEFKAYPPEYYENAIKNGMITVNSKQVETDHVLKNGDQIIHTSIRVEPPVLDLPIDIIDESDDYLIINKPPSIIVHTGGGHHYNTIENLLKF
jgi:23S rRNA-/tRNA-specific pseudouridylate synthase